MHPADDAIKFPYVVREAQRYAHLLPEGVSLDKATPAQVGAAIVAGLAEEKAHPGWYGETGYCEWYRDSAALLGAGTDDYPTAEFPAITDDGPPTVEMDPVTDDDDSSAGEFTGLVADTLTYQRICFGSIGELAGARASIRRWLNGCPVADDVVLIASELGANACLHTPSEELYFTLRAEIHPDHIRVEVEDLGGPWECRPVDDRPHGLDLVAALSEDWGTEIRTADGMRLVWAKVPAPRSSRAMSSMGHPVATWPAANITTQLALMDAEG